MKELLAFLIVILLLVFGWNQPFRDHARSIFPASGIQPSRLARLAEKAKPGAARRLPSAPATPRDSSWMRNPTSLDGSPPKH